MNYMLYPNDVEEGGETEFLYPRVKLNLKQEKLLFFQQVTCIHRGNLIYKGEKYNATGWYTYDR